jgi:hypothetical protein
LSCAKYLEDHNIEPVIFEKRERVGERFPNWKRLYRWTQAFERTAIYINKKYNNNLVPAGKVHT